MKNFLKKESSKLDVELKTAYERLNDTEFTAEHYDEVLSIIERLEKIKTNSKSQLTPETKAMIFTNLAGLLLIINHERVGVITTKALGFVNRGRI